MKKITVIVITVLSILCYSCSRNENYEDKLTSNIAAELKAEVYDEGTETPVEESKSIDVQSKPIQKIERKLIKEGSIAFETADCKETKKP